MFKRMTSTNTLLVLALLAMPSTLALPADATGDDTVKFDSSAPRCDIMIDFPEKDVKWSRSKDGARSNFQYTKSFASAEGQGFNGTESYLFDEFYLYAYKEGTKDIRDTYICTVYPLKTSADPATFNITSVADTPFNVDKKHADVARLKCKQELYDSVSPTSA
ncbi:uncharacterized protein I303_106256 [Kwoniella dejecticola CBS 10117]|uniref:Ig-like domain-containing protein n=1 Tax=Kwoniella dejecticola CBS 10117 TaxID=1296121 RepID=A0A1A6A1Q0_9TREE|nr:uncharacterized protein I303_06275 [Kwoniella dejecticola CBS 10117]OBR83988.1 hypothetical protein I303_06275 [Kwoniella dejecticola CBS 10117]